MSTDTVIALVSLTVGLMGGQFVMWRWMISKMREDRSASEVRDNDLHERVNDVKDNYVRRDDLMQHISRIENGQTQISNQLQAGLERINGRMDSFINSKTDAKAG